MDAIKKLSGWRKTAFYLTILASILTIFLVTALVMSRHVVNGGGASIFGETAILNDSCDKISRANLWIHLAINIIGTGVLGSSNFFMQVLVAPTRQDVDRAHASKRWVEIGVHSIHNFRFISKRRIFLWALFSLTSIPLHFVFNGSVLESKATNGFLDIIVSETFLDDARFTLPSVTAASNYTYALNSESAPNKTIRSLKNSLGGQSWERLGFQDSLSGLGPMLSKELMAGMIEMHQIPSGPQAGTGVIHMNETKYKPAFQTMKVDYCLSERFHAPCRLSIANPLLIIVCIMCITKCLLCIYTLKVRSWSTEEPLMTVGDAISSFVAKPDTCTLDAEDLHMKLDPDRALGTSQEETGGGWQCSESGNLDPFLHVYRKFARVAILASPEKRRRQRFWAAVSITPRPYDDIEYAATPIVSVLYDIEWGDNSNAC
ncbi:hypothetical protein FAGAP_3900 [Fusarium agapanthi]|uniref:DUF6536 domain-containing protein n=1 Tax=Fusarium agapanthi TaxID=1803897 RepID=A0A9P5BE67_9HYPO|nr:hypothetical protein FAGAP_3900 [Fusarium agapanthi]